MSENIAKKYVGALIESCEKAELNGILKDLKAISSAFGVAKFKDLIANPSISKSQKIELILSFLKEQNPKISNLINLLADNDRLNLIPAVCENLRRNIAILNNEFVGKIYSNTEISEAKIKDLEVQFSKKLNANIKLEPVVCDYNGVKIDIVDLGYEISFSIDRLKSAMSEYILKAI